MELKEPPVRDEDSEQLWSQITDKNRMPGYILTGLIILLVIGRGFPSWYNPLALLYYRVLYFLHFIPFYYSRFTFVLFEIALVVFVARRFGITPAWSSSIPLTILPRVLARAQVVDRWSTLLVGGKGLGREVIQKTRELIYESEVPDTAVTESKISAGVLQGLVGIKKDFLVARNSVNPRLKPYKMYLYAGDYGINLQVYWYVAHQPGFFRMLLNLLLLIPVINLLFLPIKLLSAKEDSVLGLDIFDEQDLRNYVTNAHRCLLQAMDNLGKDNNIDTSRISRQSKGFLGIS